jgi:hypothetical protein
MGISSHPSPPLLYFFQIPNTNTKQWNQVNAIQETDPLIYEGFTGSFASFFATGDPNAHKLTNSSEPGVPDSWMTGEEFVIATTGFSNVKAEKLDERCGFWSENAGDVPI